MKPGEYPPNIRRDLALRSEGAQGPGTELKRILAAFGIHPHGCQCMHWAAEMNRGGVQWCRAHIAHIAAAMALEAAQRGWKLPGKRFAAQALIRLAIWKATRSSPSNYPHRAGHLENLYQASSGEAAPSSAPPSPQPH